MLFITAANNFEITTPARENPKGWLILLHSTFITNGRHCSFAQGRKIKKYFYKNILVQLWNFIHFACLCLMFIFSSISSSVIKIRFWGLVWRRRRADHANIASHCHSTAITVCQFASVVWGLHLPAKLHTEAAALSPHQFGHKLETSIKGYTHNCALDHVSWSG